MQNLVTIGSKGRGCACAKFAVRRLLFFLVHDYRPARWTDWRR